MLGFGPCLVWATIQMLFLGSVNPTVPKIIPVPGIKHYPGTKRGHDFWVTGWVICILATQSEVHRPSPSAVSSGSLLETQDLSCHPRPTILESPGDLCAQYSMRSASLYLLHSIQHLMGTHCVPGIVLSITDIKMNNA